MADLASSPGLSDLQIIMHMLQPLVPVRRKALQAPAHAHARYTVACPNATVPRLQQSQGYLPMICLAKAIFDFIQSRQVANIGCVADSPQVDV